MRKRLLPVLALASAITLVWSSAAYADFTPGFALAADNSVINGNPKVDIHLEFDADDEEIGSFKLYIPKGYLIAGDEAIPDVAGPIPGRSEMSGEVIGGGSIDIHAGVDCRPGPEGAIPLGTDLSLEPVIYERPRTDEEIDAGVWAVWFLDLEPANRVRLIVKGSPLTGWTVEGTPTPSDNTCNPLVVDLTINAQSESGVPIITNPRKPGKKLFKAEIGSQDSPTVVTFTQLFTITKV